jgi:hypothetical protein
MFKAIDTARGDYKDYAGNHTNAIHGAAIPRSNHCLAYCGQSFVLRATLGKVDKGMRASKVLGTKDPS